MIDAHIEIFTHDHVEWYMNITGDLFGPYVSEDEAIDAIPGALRSIT